MSEERKSIWPWIAVLISAAAALWRWNSIPRKAPIDPTPGFNAEAAIEEYLSSHPQ